MTFLTWYVVTTVLEKTACSTFRVVWDMWGEKAVQNDRLWSSSL